MWCFLGSFTTIYQVLSLVKCDKTPQKTAFLPFFRGFSGGKRLTIGGQNDGMSLLCRPFVVPLSSLCRPSNLLFCGLTETCGLCYPVSRIRDDLRSLTQHQIYVAADPLCLGRIGGIVEHIQLVAQDQAVKECALSNAGHLGIPSEPRQRFLLHPERGALEGAFFRESALIREISSPFVWRTYCKLYNYFTISGIFCQAPLKGAKEGTLTYAMSYVDHRCRVERLEFDAPSDAAAVQAARAHLSVIREIFRADHPGATIRRGWYTLWIVTNLSTGADVYTRSAL